MRGNRKEDKEKGKEQKQKTQRIKKRGKAPPPPLGRMAQLASGPPGQPTAHSTLSVLQGHSPRPQTLNPPHSPTIPLSPSPAATTQHTHARTPIWIGDPPRRPRPAPPDDRALRHPTSAPVLDRAPPCHRTSLSPLLPRTAPARGLCLADTGAPRRHDSVAARHLRRPPRPPLPRALQTPREALPLLLLCRAPAAPTDALLRPQPRLTRSGPALTAVGPRPGHALHRPAVPVTPRRRTAPPPCFPHCIARARVAARIAIVPPREVRARTRLRPAPTACRPTALSATAAPSPCAALSPLPLLALSAAATARLARARRCPPTSRPRCPNGLRSGPPRRTPTLAHAR